MSVSANADPQSNFQNLSMSHMIECLMYLHCYKEGTFAQALYPPSTTLKHLGTVSYASGLLLIAPLGDLVRRRPLILLLILLSTALTFGQAFTNSFVAFEALSFLVGAASCVPQILVPLAADIAPPHRRATVVSIVVSGLLFGILVARVVAGLIAEFVSWRIVFYLAIGLQGLTFAMLYYLMPDYPVRNIGLSYWGILWTMAKFAVTEPVLIQASLVSLASMACFTNFWVSPSLTKTI